VIPYTIEKRPDTGVTNVTLGLWLFLASEVMLFGALFSAYALLRVSAAHWPSGRDTLNLALGSANTLILLSMTAVTWRAAAAGSARGSRGQLALATLVAVFFVGVKTAEYYAEFTRGLRPSTNTFLAMYFTLTGLHALHVIGGIIANLWAITGVTRVGERMTLGRVRALKLYWSFVDVVWMIIFVLMYLS